MGMGVWFVFFAHQGLVRYRGVLDQSGRPQLWNVSCCSWEFGRGWALGSLAISHGNMGAFRYFISTFVWRSLPRISFNSFNFPVRLRSAFLARYGYELWKCMYAVFRVAKGGEARDRWDIQTHFFFRTLQVMSIGILPGQWRAIWK